MPDLLVVSFVLLIWEMLYKLPQATLRGPQQ